MINLPTWARPFLHRRALYCFAWVMAVALAAGRIINGHLSFQDRLPFNDPERRLDGNVGHRSIDFGGQWLMGQMLASGHGRELYSRPRYWEVAQKGYPRANEAPAATRHDPDELVQHFVGQDDPRWRDFAGATTALIGSANPFEQAAIAIHGEPNWSSARLDELTHPRGKLGIGGPLYPPIHAFLMCPFALGGHPQAAYFVMQYVQMLLCFVAGLGVSRLSQGRIWWPLATSMILLYPGCRGVIDLGQNSAFSLTLLIWGWAMIARGQPALGGCVWGFLAYKPVWTVSFFLVLLLIRQWRAALAMSLTGIALVAATLPFVGIQSWLNWLAVGQQAASVYNVDANWIALSRDVLGLPPRWLLDFSLPRDERKSLLAFAASWALWALIVEITLRVFCRRGRQPIPFTGPVSALLILAAWMCSYHFMYYDALLSAFGMCVLLSEAGRWRWSSKLFVLIVLGVMIFNENVTQPLKLEATIVAQAVTSKRTLADGTTEAAPRLIVGTSDHYPIDTFLVMALWMWCAIGVLRRDSGIPLESLKHTLVPESEAALNNRAP